MCFEKDCSFLILLLIMGSMSGLLGLDQKARIYEQILSQNKSRLVVTRSVIHRSTSNHSDAANGNHNGNSVTSVANVASVASVANVNNVANVASVNNVNNVNNGNNDNNGNHHHGPNHKAASKHSNGKHGDGDHNIINGNVTTNGNKFIDKRQSHSKPSNYNGYASGYSAQPLFANYAANLNSSALFLIDDQNQSITSAAAHPSSSLFANTSPMPVVGFTSGIWIISSTSAPGTASGSTITGMGTGTSTSTSTGSTAGTYQVWSEPTTRSPFDTFVPDAGAEQPLDWLHWLQIHGQKLMVVVPLVVVMIFTMVGNVLVVISVFTYNPLRNVQNMFLVSLAISDITVAVCVMPFSIAYFLIDRWVFGIGLCKFWLTCDILCCTASILNLCAIAVDRYQAIHDPINYRTKRTLGRVLFTIVLVWLLSALTSVPPLLGWNDWPEVFDESVPCKLTEQPGYVLFSSSVSFYIPLVIMTTVYVKIFVATKQRLRRRAQSSGRVSLHKVSKRNVPLERISAHGTAADSRTMANGLPVTLANNNAVDDDHVPEEPLVIDQSMEIMERITKPTSRFQFLSSSARRRSRHMSLSDQNTSSSADDGPFTNLGLFTDAQNGEPDVQQQSQQQSQQQQQQQQQQRQSQLNIRSLDLARSAIVAASDPLLLHMSDATMASQRNTTAATTTDATIGVHLKSELGSMDDLNNNQIDTSAQTMDHSSVVDALLADQHTLDANFVTNHAIANELPLLNPTRTGSRHSLTSIHSHHSGQNAAIALCAAAISLSQPAASTSSLQLNALSTSGRVAMLTDDITSDVSILHNKQLTGSLSLTSNVSTMAGSAYNQGNNLTAADTSGGGRGNQTSVGNINNAVTVTAAAVVVMGSTMTTSSTSGGNTMTTSSSTSTTRFGSFNLLRKYRSRFHRANQQHGSCFSNWEPSNSTNAVSPTARPQVPWIRPSIGVVSATSTPTGSPEGGLSPAIDLMQVQAALRIGGRGALGGRSHSASSTHNWSQTNSTGNVSNTPKSVSTNAFTGQSIGCTCNQSKSDQALIDGSNRECIKCTDVTAECTAPLANEPINADQSNDQFVSNLISDANTASGVSLHPRINGKRLSLCLETGNAIQCPKHKMGVHKSNQMMMMSPETGSGASSSHPSSQSNVITDCTHVCPSSPGTHLEPPTPHSMWRRSVQTTCSTSTTMASGAGAAAAGTAVGSQCGDTRAGTSRTVIGLQSSSSGVCIYSCNSSCTSTSAWTSSSQQPTTSGNSSTGHLQRLAAAAAAKAGLDQSSESKSHSDVTAVTTSATPLPTTTGMSAANASGGTSAMTGTGVATTGTTSGAITVKQAWEQKQRISLSKERKAAQVLGIVMGAFIACWLPFFLMYVILPFCGSNCDLKPTTELIIVWLGYVNSALNPIIYTIFNLDFRRAFKRIFVRCCLCANHVEHLHAGRGGAKRHHHRGNKLANRIMVTKSDHHRHRHAHETHVKHVKHATFHNSIDAAVNINHNINNNNHVNAIHNGNNNHHHHHGNGNTNDNVINNHVN